MTERKELNDFDPRDIPRPTGMDHEGNMVDITDPAQPNPYYIPREPGIHPISVGDVQRAIEETKERQVQKKDKSIIERLRRANPTLSSDTYRVLKGEITEEEYKRRMNESRVKHNRKPIKRS